MYNVFEYQRYSKLEEMQGTLRAKHLEWFEYGKNIYYLIFFVFEEKGEFSYVEL